MEIECQGCYYTLCSFVCLTEDLSEILQFLWRHGCLRRSYSCEKCGRKCAIGDKDLFFRCNRNTLETPLIPSRLEKFPVQSTSQHFDQQETQTQSNGNEPFLQPQITSVTHQYLIPTLPSSEISQQGVIRFQNNTELLVNDIKVQHELLNSDNFQSDTSNLSAVPNSVLSANELNQSEKILTVIDSQASQIVRNNDPTNVVATRDHLLPTLQIQSIDIGTFKTEFKSEEPSPKIFKKLKSKNGKTPKKRCNFKVSMKKGTFFEKSKLPIDTVCKFVVFWCCMKHPTQEFLRNELSLATRTVVDWSTACREICIHWAKSVSEKIGGDGVMVQVDEVKIQDSKDSKQSDNGNKYSFWGMEKDKEKGKIFIVPVPACDSWSLLTVINDWILPGSVIISNCWKAYDCLKLQEFIQQTIVQSKTFVHPQSNAGQNFEGKVDEACTSGGGELQMPKFGTRRSHHLGDLAEFMFKRRYSNHLERMHAFFKQISLAAAAKEIRRNYFSKNSGPQLCIIGGGPAGFYSAQQLIKLIPNATVDIYERLPVPFGLVRYGVAPDHSDVKKVINTFTKTAKSPKVNFYGNICLSENFSLKNFQNSYHAVLLTYGAEEDRKLDIAGEELENVISARRFVGWYNGLPQDRNLKVDLDVENVVIVGQGNVAIDVARILLSSTDKLMETDITEYSLEKLSNSKVKSVSFIGRRGPLQIACTIKELREIINLPEVTAAFNKADFEGLDQIIPNLSRPRKRLTELLYKSALNNKISGREKTFNVVFKRTPLGFSGVKKVSKIEMAVNTLEGSEIELQKAVVTKQKDILPCDLALRSIGYKSVQAEPSIPFDFKKGIVINQEGKVAPGLYASGWLSTGPIGVILSTMNNAFATAQLIHKEIEEKMVDVKITKPGSQGILTLAKEKGIQIVRFEDWEKIDKEEKRRGEAKGKPREKIVSIKEMLEIAS